MKDGNVYEFLDHSSYEEVAVEYGGYKFFFYGLRRDPITNLYSFTIERYELGFNGAYIDTVYDKQAPSKKECMEQFYYSPLFDGKTFWELEKDMTWIEW